MNSDGSNVTPLITEPANAFGPDVSPDGTRLTFYSLGNDPGSGSVSVANIDGSNLTRLIRGGSPAWSPDGAQIVFDQLDFDPASDDRFYSTSTR